MLDLNPLLGRNWVTDGTHWVSAAFARLADAINEYDSEMFLVWIQPQDRRGDETHPYGILHQPLGRPEYIVFTLTEAEMEDTSYVLYRVARGDLRKHDVFKEIEIFDAADRALKQKERDEALAEQRDIAMAALKSPKHKWMHKGKNWR